PAQLERLRADPTLMPGAVREMLRFDSPVQLIDRYVADDTEIGGIRLKRGDVVTAVVGSGNHDSARFPDGDAFDITRNAEGHLAFGDGIHRCLGAPLADLVAPVAFRAMLDQLPGLRLAGTPQWRSDPFLRSPSSLPIAYG
ncbi:MAG: cytochrome P450, partial [Gemmatimonadetes bacterium]|nr:cytochrome P450 [Gemmatimonadota bacterium]